MIRRVTAFAIDARPTDGERIEGVKARPVTDNLWTGDR